jgi:CII-binding regulator of phage lambda lysogenization HflD
MYVCIMYVLYAHTYLNTKIYRENFVTTGTDQSVMHVASTNRLRSGLLANIRSTVLYLAFANQEYTIKIYKNYNFPVLYGYETWSVI